MSSDYALLAQIFEGQIAQDDVLVDVGCGKGRVINWWLSQNLRNKMVGIELEEDVALKAQRRLRKHSNVTILAGDAIERLPADGTLFFLYDPFDESTTWRFKRVFENRYVRRDAKVIYHAPVHLDVFKGDPRWRISEFTLDVPDYGRFEEAHRFVAILRLAER